MSLLNDLRANITADTTVQSYISPTSAIGAVAENKLNEASPSTAILFFLASRQAELDLNGGPIITTSEVDIEIHSSSLLAADGLADYLRGKFDGFSGELVASGFYVRSCFATDEDETYETKGNFSDDAIHIIAIKLTVTS